MTASAMEDFNNFQSTIQVLQRKKNIHCIIVLKSSKALKAILRM